MGYGTRALQALNAFYNGEYFNLDEAPLPDAAAEAASYFARASGFDDVSGLALVGHRYSPDLYQSTTLLTDNPTVRAPSAMPPLLQRLTERRPERLDYLGVSYGLTSQLLRFWKRAGFVPLYLRQTTNELTGEHTCVMVRGVGDAHGENVEWLGEFAKGAPRTAVLCSLLITDVDRLPSTVPHTLVFQVPRIRQRHCAEHHRSDQYRRKTP